MKGGEFDAEIAATERAIERAARQVQQEGAAPAVWRRALAAYEAAWMAALKALRCAEKRAA